MKWWLYITAFMLVSCNNDSRTGIDGNNNSNNNIIIADKVEMPDEEEKKYRANYDITTDGVGGIKLGQTIDEIQQFFKRNTNFTIQTDEGARTEGTDFAFPTIYVLDDSKKEVFGIQCWDLKVATVFEVYSQAYKTYNNIHVGMSIADVSALYGNDLILYVDELNEEFFFEPFDLKGNKGKIQIYVRASDGQSLLKVDSIYDTRPENYRKQGTVSYIRVASKND